MALVPKKFFEEMPDFFGDEDWFLPVFSKKSSEPDMDVYETEKEVIVEVSLPNIDPKDIKVSVDDGILKVRGGTKDEKEDKKKNYWKKEIRRGSFERAVRLPSSVDDNKADANYEKGVLKVVLPKAEPKSKKLKEIKVKAK